MAATSTILYVQKSWCLDDVIVYPGHGAGSSCGKNMSKETVELSVSRRQQTMHCAGMTEEEFIKEVTDGLQNHRPTSRKTYA